MTWLTLARLVAVAHGFGDLTDIELDFVLWEHTAYPLADAAYITGQLDAFFDDLEKGPLV